MWSAACFRGGTLGAVENACSLIGAEYFRPWAGLGAGLRASGADGAGGPESPHSFPSRLLPSLLPSRPPSLPPSFPPALPRALPPLTPPPTSSLLPPLPPFPPHASAVAVALFLPDATARTQRRARARGLTRHCRRPSAGSGGGRGAAAAAARGGAGAGASGSGAGTGGRPVWVRHGTPRPDTGPRAARAGGAGERERGGGE